MEIVEEMMDKSPHGQGAEGFYLTVCSHMKEEHDDFERIDEQMREADRGVKSARSLLQAGLDAFGTGVSHSKEPMCEKVMVRILQSVQTIAAHARELRADRRSLKKARDERLTHRLAELRRILSQMP